MSQLLVVDQAENELRSFDEKTKSKRLAYEAKVDAARQLGAHYRRLVEKEQAASACLTHALDKIDLLKQRIERENKFLLDHLPNCEFSKGWYVAYRADPLEQRPSTYMQSGGEHPYVFAGRTIAGAQAVIELFTSALPRFEAEAEAAKSEIDAFVQEHGRPSF